jgi:hypothetical protein
VLDVRIQECKNLSILYIAIMWGWNYQLHFPATFTQRKEQMTNILYVTQRKEQMTNILYVRNNVYHLTFLRCGMNVTVKRIGTPASCFGSPELASRLGMRLFRLRYAWISAVPSGTCWYSVSKSTTTFASFLICHGQSSCYSTLCRPKICIWDSVFK